MIPKIIHQTWKTNNVPENCKAYVQTWKTLHPDWKYILWTDADLDEFIAAHYPDFLEIFRNYPKGVQRADAARYLLLHRFGGVYTDLDTECLSSFNIFSNEKRIVFCEEPKAHCTEPFKVRTLDKLLFNGTMVSPAGHPFWLVLFEAMKENRFTSSVMDSTGPFLMAATVQNYPHPNQFSISSAHLFCGLDAFEQPLADRKFGEYGSIDLSVHHWMCSWNDWPIERRKKNFRPIKKATKFLQKLIYLAQKGLQFSPEINKTVANFVLSAPSESEDIAVLIPIRDGKKYLERCLKLLGELDWPKSQLHITFCEGDSIDGTMDAIIKLALENKFGFGSIKIIHKPVYSKFTHERRWLPKLQRQRRAGLAQVRNHLIDNAIQPETDWVLWIDVDVNNYPPSILKNLLKEREKIVVPHCLRDDGSNQTFDLNSFATVYNWRDYSYFKHMIGGIYQPPMNSDRRLHLNDTRYLHKLPLNGVGGTMILVHASVHRAGIRFPDLPYKDLIETEGFGQLARDHGIIPIGLPNLIITHPV